MRVFFSRCSVFAGAVILCTVLFAEPNLVRAEKRAIGRYSIHFKDASISDALNQLAAAARIRITMESVLDARITKAYRNERIDEIIRDMFKNMSYVSVWTYGQEGVDSINIRVFEEDNSVESPPVPLPEPTLPVFNRPRTIRRVPSSQPRSAPGMARRTDGERDDGSEDQQAAEKEDQQDAEKEDQQEEEKPEPESSDKEKEENDSVKSDEKDTEKEDTAASTDEKEGNETDADKASGSQ